MHTRLSFSVPVSAGFPGQSPGSAGYPSKNSRSRVRTQKLMSARATAFTQDGERWNGAKKGGGLLLNLHIAKGGEAFG